MANVQQFIKNSKQALKRASKIYAVMKQNGTKGISAWREAVRQAWKYLKAIKKGEVTFWKLDGTITTRKISSLEGNYEFKGTASHTTDTLKVWDVVKQSVISFYPFQIL